MEVELEAGIHVDLATKDDIEGYHHGIRQLFQDRTVAYKELSSGVPTGAQFLTADLGMPAPGHLWSVQWAAVWGDTPFGAAIANVTAAVFVGTLTRPVQSTAPVQADDVAVPAQPVPSSIPVPDLTIVRGGQHLYIVFGGSGTAAGATVGYNATAGILEARDTPETLSWL